MLSLIQERRGMYVLKRRRKFSEFSAMSTIEAIRMPAGNA
jgi:hypothetical protein